MLSRERRCLTDRRYVGNDLATGPVEGYVENVLLEDNLVCDALARRGLRVSRLAWCDPAVNWSNIMGAVFRTTWDYFDRWPAFSAWLETAASKTILLNAPDILRWNLDKHYLQDLKAEGIAVVPTAYLPKACPALFEVMERRGWTMWSRSQPLQVVRRHLPNHLNRRHDPVSPFLPRPRLRDPMAYARCQARHADPTFLNDGWNQEKSL